MAESKSPLFGITPVPDMNCGGSVACCIPTLRMEASSCAVAQFLLAGRPNGPGLPLNPTRTSSHRGVRRWRRSTAYERGCRCRGPSPSNRPPATGVVSTPQTPRNWPTEIRGNETADVRNVRSIRADGTIVDALASGKCCFPRQSLPGKHYPLGSRKNLEQIRVASRNAVQTCQATCRIRGVHRGPRIGLCCCGCNPGMVVPQRPVVAGKAFTRVCPSICSHAL